MLSEPEKAVFSRSKQNLPCSNKQATSCSTKSPLKFHRSDYMAFGLLHYEYTYMYQDCEYILWSWSHPQLLVGIIVMMTGISRQVLLCLGCLHLVERNGGME